MKQFEEEGEARVQARLNSVEKELTHMRSEQ
jgi:hypothetical protein